MKLKEDFWISCLVKYHYRKILVDNRFNFSQKDTMINSGGLSKIRNKEEEKRSILILKKYFGDSIELKRNRESSKLLSKYNVSAIFKY
jgi:hypothetical protein